MEYWSIEKRHQTLSQYSNTPVLQYSNFLYLRCTLSINCNLGWRSNLNLAEAVLILPVNLHMV
jgi:hypothetical protein